MLGPAREDVSPRDRAVAAGVKEEEEELVERLGRPLCPVDKEEEVEDHAVRGAEGEGRESGGLWLKNSYEIG